MTRRKREPMSEGKKNIIAELIEEYDIRAAKDIEDALRDLMGGTIQEMLEEELDEHLGYRSYERSDSSNYRNGKKTKKIRGNLGETEIEVPQDRDGTFEPKVVKKRQKDISGIEQKIISLYANDMTTRQISDTTDRLLQTGFFRLMRCIRSFLSMQYTFHCVITGRLGSWLHM